MSITYLILIINDAYPTNSDNIILTNTACNKLVDPRLLQSHKSLTL